jgi:hypothetical protein
MQCSIECLVVRYLLRAALSLLGLVVEVGGDRDHPVPILEELRICPVIQRLGDKGSKVSFRS